MDGSQSSESLGLIGPEFLSLDDYAKKGEKGGADSSSTEQKQDAKSSDAAAVDNATKKEGKTEIAAKTDAPAKSDAPAKPSGSSSTTSGGTKD